MLAVIRSNRNRLHVIVSRVQYFGLYGGTSLISRAASSSSSSTSIPRGAISVEPVKSGPRAATPKPAASADDNCGTAPAADDDLTDMVPMIDPASGTSRFLQNKVERARHFSHLPYPPLSLLLFPFSYPIGEWGGPTKGGTVKEPTRFGDWERKGRCTDFE